MHPWNLLPPDVRTATRRRAFEIALLRREGMPREQAVIAVALRVARGEPPAWMDDPQYGYREFIAEEAHA